jgi:hypothetical protein
MPCGLKRANVCALSIVADGPLGVCERHRDLPVERGGGLEVNPDDMMGDAVERLEWDERNEDETPYSRRRR